MSPDTDSASEIQAVLLRQLNGLQLPEPVGWWPLAPGWWVVAGLALLLCVWLISIFINRSRARNPVWQAQAQLGFCYEQWQLNGNDSNYAETANRLLRQLAIAQHGRKQVARPTGSDWVHWLHANSTVSLSSQVRDCLSRSCYQLNPNISVPQLHQELSSWIKSSSMSRRRLQRSTSMPVATESAPAVADGQHA